MVNKVILIGNIGKDPDVKHTDNSVVATFSLATSETWKNKDGEKVNKTEWHNIVCWRNLAEIVEKYMTKGQQIYVEGKLTHRDYEDKEGVKRYITEVVADKIQMLGRKDEKPSVEKPAPKVEEPLSEEDDFINDLPF